MTGDTKHSASLYKRKFDSIYLPTVHLNKCDCCTDAAFDGDGTMTVIMYKISGLSAIT